MRSFYNWQERLISKDFPQLKMPPLWQTCQDGVGLTHAQLSFSQLWPFRDKLAAADPFEEGIMRRYQEQPRRHASVRTTSLNDVPIDLGLEAVWERRWEGRSVFKKNYGDTERPAHSQMDTWNHSFLRTTWFRRVDHEWLITWIEQSASAWVGIFSLDRWGPSVY